MGHRIDERSGNIQKIKKDIKNTQHNLEFANDMIENISDSIEKKKLKEKNERRLESIETMIKDVNNKVLD